MKNFNHIFIYKKKKKLNYKLNKFSFLVVRSLFFLFFDKKNFESARRFISRKLKKKLKFIIYKKTFKFKTFKKSQKSRMGKGKGKFNIWLWDINKYQKLIEISYLKKKKFFKFILKNLLKKLPTKVCLSY